MTQIHFTLNQEEIQKLINDFVEGTLSQRILTKVFHELMEKQRDVYINAEHYERNDD